MGTARPREGYAQVEELVMANGARAMAAGKIAREMARALTSVLKRRSAAFTKKALESGKRRRSKGSHAPRPEK